jgi:protoporphyrinogen oxidase
VKIAILGAGVTGLALARYLVEGGVDSESVTLLEAGAEVGGLCRSKTVDGFTYDVAGGHILYSKDAEAMQWMKDCAGGDERFVTKDRNTRIRFEDRWVNYPFENGIGDLPKQANFDCIQGYVAAWHARKMDGSEAPADFKNWVQWRFGDGIAKHFMDPYNEKVWKRELEDISSGWVAGRVPDAPVDDVLRSAVGIRTEGYTHQAIFYYPDKGGFQAITDGMASSLAGRIRLNTKVTEVVKGGESWKVNGEEFDLVINTLSLSYLPDIIAGMPGDIADAMNKLEFNSLVCLLFALDRPEHPDLSWIYLPHANQGPANRVTYMSNYAPGNAPEGKTSLMAEVTWRGGVPQPGAELDAEVQAGMLHAGLMKEEEILFVDRCSVPQAYVVFDHDFDKKRDAALNWIEGEGLYTVGRFARFDYDNSDQCVIKARELSKELLAKIAKG